MSDKSRNIDATAEKSETERKGSMLDSPSFFSSSKAGEGVGHELRVIPFKRNAVQMIWWCLVEVPSARDWGLHFRWNEHVRRKETKWKSIRMSILIPIVAEAPS